MSDNALGRLVVNVKRKDEGATQMEFVLSRMACDEHGYADLIEVVGPSQSVASLRACLSGASIDHTMKVHDCKGARKGVRLGSINDKYIYRSMEGYTCHVSHMGLGQIHALFQSRDKKFIPVFTDEGLYRALKSDQFTTPLLRAWIPWLKERMTNEDHMAILVCFRCDCAKLAITNDDLDKLVSRGVRDGHLLMGEKSKLAHYLERESLKEHAHADQN